MTKVAVPTSVKIVKKNMIVLKRKNKMDAVKQKSSRFEYVIFDDLAKLEVQTLQQQFEVLESLIYKTVDEGRAKSLALTALEESFMWCGKQIRDDQLKRNEKPA